MKALGIIVEKIFAGLRSAEEKHPGWPDDFVYGSAIIAEEAGETVRAALHFYFEGGSLDEIEKEAIHTAVTSIRILIEVQRQRSLIAEKIEKAIDNDEDKEQ